MKSLWRLSCPRKQIYKTLILKLSFQNTILEVDIQHPWGLMSQYAYSNLGRDWIFLEEQNPIDGFCVLYNPGF